MSQTGWSRDDGGSKDTSWLRQQGFYSRLAANVAASGSGCRFGGGQSVFSVRGTNGLIPAEGLGVSQAGEGPCETTRGVHVAEHLGERKNGGSGDRRSVLEGGRGGVG